MKKQRRGNFLASGPGLRLGLSTFTAMGLGLIEPMSGPKILQDTWCGKKKKKNQNTPGQV